MTESLALEELTGGGVLQAQFGFSIKFWLSNGPVVTIECNFELKPQDLVLDPGRPETCGEVLRLLHDVVEHAYVKGDLLELSFRGGSRLLARSPTLFPGWTVELPDGTNVVPRYRR